MDVGNLASAGATAIIAAMATDAWTWARAEVSRLFGRREADRDQEAARLNSFADQLATVAERDVHNRLAGYIEARLIGDEALGEGFPELIAEICRKIGLEPPPLNAMQTVVATHSVVVQTAGGDAYVKVASVEPKMIRWNAMTGPQAAQKLAEMDLPDAVEALADMDPALAARRFSHVRPDRAEQLLAHMDEGLAADLLSRLTGSVSAADLLALVEPARAAAILDVTDADWAVARLAEMNPDRALVVLATMGAKRTDDLLHAMERQQAVRLLSSVGKVLSEQARTRTTFEFAQQEAERIAAAARKEADATLEKARLEAQAIVVSAQKEPAAAQPTPAAGLPATPLELAPEHFRLPTAYFLLAHDGEGRPRIDQSTLEVGVAGAALCELVRVGLVDVVEGALVASDSYYCPDVMAGLAMSTLGEHPRQPVSSWLRAVRKDLFHALAQQLSDAGIVMAIAKPWLAFRSAVRYKPTDEAAAAEPGRRIVGLFVRAQPVADQDTLLLADIVHRTQLHQALPINLRPTQIRGLLEQVKPALTPTPAIRAVLAGIDDAITAIMTTPRLR